MIRPSPLVQHARSAYSHLVRRFPVASAVVITTGLTILLGTASWLVGVREGLDAQYLPALDVSGTPARAAIDTRFSTAGLMNVWQSEPPPTFTAHWRGGLLVLVEGTYTFASISDDGSTIDVDGTRVVDNSGAHPPTRREGSITLTRGVHDIAIDFTQEGVAFSLEVLWGRSGEALSHLPGWRLAPERASFVRFLTAAALHRVRFVVEWAWVVTITLASLLLLWRGWAAIRRQIVTGGDWPALRRIVLASLVLNLAGVWWGLPAEWVQIELTPGLILNGLAQHFSHGWFDTYPPVHFYLLSAAMGPLVLLNALGRINLDLPAYYPVLIFSFRLVSIAMASGIVIAAYVCGKRAFNRRAGLFAAAMVALIAPFLYYAKTANVDVPYIFWFSISLVFYLRLLDTLATRDFVVFAAAAALAVCTKDQAYGFYFLMPIGIIYRLWRARRDAGQDASVWRVLVDRRLVIGAITAAVLFVLAHNLLFNFHGFVQHVRDITGSSSQDYRMFDRTFVGRMTLLRFTGDLIARSLGWPFTIVALAGVALALTSAHGRRMTFLLALPVVSYYLSFINVILYNYDRFVIPICFVLALFGGFAFDRLLAAVRVRVWRIAIVGGVFAYTLLYAAAVDVLMMDDSRYAVQAWMEEHVKPDALIGTCFDLQYLPDVDRYRHADLCSRSEIGRVRPDYFIINADYAQEVPSDTHPGQLVAGLVDRSLGYRLVLLKRHRAPWPWLPGAHPDLVGPRNEQYVASTLRNINPTIAVYQRID
jgi:hypothetical protein